MTSLEDAHASLLRNRQLQFEMHDVPQPPVEGETWHWSLGNWPGPVVWTLVTIAALVILVLVVQYVWQRATLQGPAGPAAAEPEADVPLEIARLALSDADRLAADGRFADAAHALLACGVDEIARRYPAALRPATTSRDIAASTSLPEHLRKAFGRIAATVEVGLFGGRTIAAADYASCRQVFVSSALAGRG